MIDIHCHILPGLDDGPREFEQAVEMCRMAREDGITHTVATPHANFNFEFSPEKIRATLEQLRSLAKIAPAIVTGCDFHLDYDNLQNLYAGPQNYTVNQKSYLLVEFDSTLVVPNFERVFYELQAHGLNPIVTHPERNLAIQQQPSLLERMVAAGAAVQITAGSLEGRFGRRAESSARQLVKQNLVHIVASDAHDLESRPPILSAAYERVKKQFSEELARAFFLENPQAVLNGEPLPYFPEPREQKEKRGWFNFSS